MKNIFQKALARDLLKVPPVWMMRQAGRYHSHYQNLRKKHSFMDLCLRPELAAEVAMGPVDDFDFDAAILFSDILFPLKALGMPLDYTEAGPQLGFKLDLAQFEKLKAWPEAIPEMNFQKKAMQLTRERLPLNKALIGFVGGPWTLFVYAVDSTHSGSLIQSKTQWDLWQKFSGLLVPFLKENIRLQFQGGADVVMILDTAAGELAPGLFQKMIQPALQDLALSFPGQLGYYSKSTTADHFDSAWEKIPWAGQGYDHRRDIVPVLQKAQGFVQGNFDQSLLHLEEKSFKKFFQEYLRPLQELSPEQRRGWICGVGHGLVPKTPEANVRNFVELLRRGFE